MFILTASVRSPEIYSLPKGIGTYNLHTEEEDFDGALVTCASEGAHLAIIETYAEAEILRYIFQEYENATNTTAYSIFVGCDDMEEEGLFVTVKSKYHS